jgi:hypothetical protein
MITCSYCSNAIVGRYRIHPFAYGTLQEEIGISFCCPPCDIGRKWSNKKLKIKIERQKMKIKFEAI